MNTMFDEDRNVSDAPLFDPFPEPQTMPAGWDLSEIIPLSGLTTDSGTTSISDPPLS